MKKIFTSTLLFLTVFAISVSLISAQAGGGGSTPGQGGGNTSGQGGGNTPGASFTLDNPFAVGNDLPTLLQAIVNNIVLPIGGILCVLAFIFAGFKFVTAGGDTSKLKDARTALLYAAIGTILILGAWAIAEVLRTTIGQVTGKPI